ncbi:MAG: cyanophycinase [Planctomycetota bacterium]
MTRSSRLLVHIAVALLVTSFVVQPGFAQTSQPPAVPSFKLFIHGGGGVSDECDAEFLRLAGGTDATLVVIPTATSDENLPSLERTKEIWANTGITDIQLFHTRSREQANDEQFVKVLSEADAIWISGGSQQRLADAYADTLVEKALLDAVHRGAVVGGSSAGAAIQSKVMIARGRDQPEISNGLDLLPNSILDQHFLRRSRINRLIEAIKLHPDRTGIGIDERTSLCVEDGKATVVGSSYVVTVRIVDGELDIRSFSAGDELDLADLGLVER